ncbi:hypothetical protein BDW62DRAFT_186633 [Aspergillus aurantiobrunneus]
MIGLLLCLLRMTDPVISESAGKLPTMNDSVRVSYQVPACYTESLLPNSMARSSALYKLETCVSVGIVQLTCGALPLTDYALHFHDLGLGI